MDPTMLKLRNHIDSLLSYLTPLLPLANCHMVEFLTHNHWETLLPKGLRETLDGMALDQAVEEFWNVQNEECGKSPLALWVHTARKHCLSVNNDYCLSVDQLEQRIKDRGGVLPREIPVKEFMNPKKSYEVRIMSRLLSLHHMVSACCSVEAGGGRGHLLVTASHGYKLRCLTVDCDKTSLTSAEARGKLIQKQWHAISNTGARGTDHLHRFAELFVTEQTDLATVVKESFPEVAEEDLSVMLTGLHTCGDLGPSSLRIFVSQSTTSAVFNVPCCYHLLTEDIKESTFFDDFQSASGAGFPMSEHLRGFTLGRNARMLAAQSLERVFAKRELPSRSLLYRSLLQAIIKKNKPDFVLADGRLKRIGAKSRDFNEYFKLADSILKLNLFDTLSTDSLVVEYYQWKNMVLFYLIRLCLAQVIESLILLDRLLFLKENGFNDTFLVKLFDPVLSPRCHSIVAIR
ncbi:probable methyltransferase-like protein 25 [Leguminivora glycinivorella]|uniref:probable methyltransferase-like protein 25 n=1 Tax=Leguminivora glycinivorella TaxID=1035111 RepID=UPI00200F13A1|nr:probable methyltransferase-like protein 25 [Leguminivora glycinivorella]